MNRYTSVWNAIYDDPSVANQKMLKSKCLHKCLTAIETQQELVVCEEFNWDTVVDTVLDLRERGYKARTCWGDIVLCIHLDY